MSSSIELIMIEMAIDIFLKDLREDPGRAMRNLIDLGMRFSKGRFRSDFLPYAQATMSDLTCPYYRLLENVARNIEGKALKTFGINLGYRALACGAREIRQSERRVGHYLPWCLIFDFREEGPLSNNAGEILRVISESRDYGIKAFMLFADPRRFPLDALVAHFRDCAFFLFTEPSAVDATLIRVMRSAGNVACSIAASFGDPDSARAAAGALSGGKCLFGFHVWYDSADELRRLGPSWLGRCERDRGIFAFFLRDGPDTPDSTAAANAFIGKMRITPDYGVLAADFYGDLASVNALMGVSPRLAVIRGDGSIGTALGGGNRDPMNAIGRFPEGLLRVMPPVDFF